ncbi:hypothetical protein [Glycomyces artemisiae]|uniref:Secreted protein n=1 Tax=Glycomyces artemisiae TaxID=1076443 RepID=A0A2T0US31_9ACTN|nr:hypothetical protein [Glycomyces artemisiae]PRY60716.1 hypothetical protein B0I28_102325 [Glycomyces artemisiae]
MRKRISAVLATAAASAAIVLMTGTAASASTSYAKDVDWNSDPKTCHQAVTGYYSPKVDACYEEDGDILWVLDRQADGYSSRMVWQNLTRGTSGSCVHNIGADKGWAACDFDWPEGDTIVWDISWDTSSGWKSSGRQVYSNA